MKLDFSIEISKKCIMENICCRKSSKIAPQYDNTYRVYDSTSYTPHIGSSNKGGGGVCMIGCLFCCVLSCILAPVFGLCIGPILYWIKVANGEYYTAQPTLTPTISPINNSYVITL
jgi:hypothetical protein